MADKPGSKAHPAVKKAQDAHKQMGDALTEIAQALAAAKQQQPDQMPAPAPASPGLPSNGVSPMGGTAR